MRENCFWLTLDFNVNDDPGFVAIFAPHFDQLVCPALAHFCVADDLLEFGIQKLVASAPINLGIDLGKEKCQELSKMALDDVLPGVIEILTG